MDVIEPMLDEEEHAVYKRGRNASLIQRQRMLLLQITDAQPVLKHLWDICTCREGMCEWSNLSGQVLLKRLDADEI